MLDKTTTTRNAAFFGEFLDGLRTKANSGGMARRNAHNELSAEDPVLALICEIEAHADQRIFANDSSNSKLSTIRDLARNAMIKITGTDTNPIYPASSESPTDRWRKAAP